MHEPRLRFPVPADHDYAIVLAGGSGARLAGLARDAEGRPVPKQFCSLRGGRSLLRDALARAEALVPAGNLLVVVAAEHEAWWRAELADRAPGNVIVQPRNRGTAPGILLPLRAILARDPQARVVVLPSDHFVQREDVLLGEVRRALLGPHVAAGGLVLLGIRPERLELEYGWILPGEARRGAFTVSAFVEKPGTASALTLAAHGALWNSFVFAVRADALWRMFRRRQPELLAAFAAPEFLGAPAALYDAIPTVDFSSGVLQGSERFLRVQPVPECGWTDLGTPERVRECLDRLREERRAERIGGAADLESLLAQRDGAALAAVDGRLG